MSHNDPLQYKYLGYGNGTYHIKDGGLYAFGGASSTGALKTNVEGKTKYIFKIEEDYYALTEEGTLWKRDTDRTEYFDKMNFDKRVIDICRYNNMLGIEFKRLFFLLEDGSLVDENGIRFENYDHGFVKVIEIDPMDYYNEEKKVYVKNDNTVYKYDFEKDDGSYIQIKDEEGENLIINSYFVKKDSVYIISNNNKFVYIDDSTACEFKDTKGKKVEKFEKEEFQDEEYDTTYYTITINFDDGTKKVIKDAYEYYD